MERVSEHDVNMEEVEDPRDFGAVEAEPAAGNDHEDHDMVDQEDQQENVEDVTMAFQSILHFQQQIEKQFTRDAADDSIMKEGFFER